MKTAIVFTLILPECIQNRSSSLLTTCVTCGLTLKAHTVHLPIVWRDVKIQFLWLFSITLEQTCTNTNERINNSIDKKKKNRAKKSSSMGVAFYPSKNCVGPKTDLWFRWTKVVGLPKVDGGQWKRPMSGCHGDDTAWPPWPSWQQATRRHSSRHKSN